MKRIIWALQQMEGAGPHVSCPVELETLQETLGFDSASILSESRPLYRREKKIDLLA